MDIANRTQAVNGVDNSKIMTPLRTREAITANSSYKILKDDLYLRDGELPNLEDGYYFVKHVYFNGSIDKYFTNALVYYDTSQTNGLITSVYSPLIVRQGYAYVYRTYNTTTNTWTSNYYRSVIIDWGSIRSKPIVTEINSTTATDSNIPSALAVKNYIDSLLGR